MSTYPRILIIPNLDMAESIKLRPKTVDNEAKCNKELLYCYQAARDFISKEDYKEKEGSHDGVIYTINGHQLYVYRTPTLIVSRIDKTP